MTPASLKIRLYGDPCLRAKSSSVKEVGPSERILIQSMLATMHQQKGIGLAAPQVGINKRIVVADIGQGPMALINPKIVDKAGLSEMDEGCLSIPEVTIKVKRPSNVVVEFVDENNEKMEMQCDELMARVIQHEIDHLDGKLIVDYASKEELAKWKEKLQEIERKT